MLDRDEPKRIAALRRLLGLVAMGNETSEQMRQEVDLISGAQAPAFRCGDSADPTRIAASSPVGENIHQYG